MRVVFPRRALRQFSLLLGAASFLSCGGDGGSPSPTPTSVHVTPGTDTLVAIGEHQAFSATVLDANGDPIDGATVTWSSDAPGVLSIDATTGLATAVTRGSAHVKATAGALEGSAAVFVTQIVTTVTVTPGNTALDGVGDTVRFTAVAKDSGGTLVNGVQVIWSVNDNTVATIDTLGLATAKGPGVVLVTALAQTRAGYAALGVTQTAASLAFTSVPDSGLAGTPFNKVVQVEVRDSNGHRVQHASLPVTIGVSGGNGPFGMVGPVTITTVDGVTNFPGLGVTRAGTLQLTASAPGLGTSTSAAFPVAPDLPTQLTVVAVQDTMVAGDTLKGRIEIQDRFGNRTHVNGVYVQLYMRRHITGSIYDIGFLAGSQDVQVNDGFANAFASRVTAAGDHWQLVAYTAGFDTAYGGDATILPGVPARTIVYFTGIQSLSPWVGVGVARSPGLVGVITDDFLNPQPAAPPTLLTLNDSSWSYQPPFIIDDRQDIFGVLQAMTVDGVAHFDTVGLLRPGPTYLVATGGGYHPWANLVSARLYGKHGLSVGNAHACVLSDGGPFCWGSSSHGQLSATFGNDSVAGPVAGGAALTWIGAGTESTCGLFADGTAACWGANGAAQLGRGTQTLSQPDLAPVVTAVKFSSLALGFLHACGIGKADSLAYCWGSNAEGQLGDSSITIRSTPVVVKGGHKFIQLAAGALHTCGLEAGSLGLVWCWGRNQEGQGGHGSTTPAVDSIPKLVEADSNLTIHSGAYFNCAEFRDPSGAVQVRCWGRNGLGEVGSDTVGTGPHPTPATIIGVGAIRPGTLTVGDDHACVVAVSGQLWCWGSNDQHRFANLSGTVFNLPFQVNSFGMIPVGASVVAGGTFTCALFPPSGFGVTVGDTRCIGRNVEGQLGNGSTVNPAFPPVTAVQ